jgi:hypothetical protein
MAILTRLKPALEGTAYTLQAVASEDKFVNNGCVYLHVKNAGGSPDNVTIKGVGPCELGTVHDEVIAVANGTEAIIGPFRPDRFNDAQGFVTVQHSFVTSVTCRAIEVSQ